MLLVLLTLGEVKPPRRVAEVSVVKLISPAPDQAATPEQVREADPREPKPSSRREYADSLREPPPVEQAPADQVQAKTERLPPTFIPLPRDQMAAADISRLPTPPTALAARGAKMGPPDTRSATDSPRVEGAGPNGEPLYAASWYREPYDNELSGYLSTASGPGWGLIACRTVTDFRVDDCIGLDEYPSGSNITRAVLAAAWQFRVRPPRIGGRSQVGEWVRIRIELRPGGIRGS